MKIIAIGRNYAEHAKELNNPVPTTPVIFMKPDTAILKDNKPFYHPDFSEDVHLEIELVLTISKIVPKTNFHVLYNLNFKLDINGELRQQGNTKDLLFPFERIIAFVSRY